MISQILQKILSFVAIAPVDNDGTAIVGTTIDRLSYLDAYVLLNFAASTGTPTTALAAVTVYHGDASNMSDEALLCTCDAALNIKAAGKADYPIDLTGAKRYIRVKLDTTYVDGTAPKNIIAASAVLGNKNIEPVATQTVLGR